MEHLRNLTIKDEWLRHCRLLLDLGMQDAARDLYRVIMTYAYHNVKDGWLIKDSRDDVRILFNTIMHEMDTDEVRLMQLTDVAREEEESEEG